MWKASRRTAYDLDYNWTLDAITDTVNQSKSDHDPAEWLPAKIRCTYPATGSPSSTGGT